MNFAEAVRHHQSLTQDRATLHNQHEATYTLDPLITDLQKRMLSLLATEMGSEDPALAAARSRIEYLERAAKLYYRADGTSEMLATDWHVTERRKQDAAELERLRAEVARLRDELGSLREQPGVRASLLRPESEVEQDGARKVDAMLAGAMADETPEKVPVLAIEPAPSAPTPVPFEQPF